MTYEDCLEECVHGDGMCASHGETAHCQYCFEAEIEKADAYRDYVRDHGPY